MQRRRCTSLHPVHIQDWRITLFLLARPAPLRPVDVRVLDSTGLIFEARSSKFESFWWNDERLSSRSLTDRQLCVSRSFLFVHQ